MMTESGVGVDLDALQNYADTFHNDNEDQDSNDDDNSGFWEREVKYDPSVVKAEADEEPEDPLHDHFLTSDLCTANETEDAGPTPSKNKPQQRRRKKLDSDDDGEDKTWSPYSSKQAKSKPMSARTKRKNKKVIAEKRKVASKEKRALMTQEQKNAEASRKRVLRAEQRSRREEEISLKCLVGEDEDEDDEDEVEEKFSSLAPKPRRKTTSRRKKASEMTPEELEVARAKWRDERRRARGSKLVRETENEKRKSKRKPVSEMTEEEREKMRAKWREETRRRRQGLTASKLSKSETDVIDVIDIDGGTQNDFSEISAEEREVKKAKWRETARIWRQRRRERMSEEERQAYLAKAREQKRKAREAAMASLSPEELSEFKRQDAQRKFLANLQRRAMMTEVEIREEKQRLYMREMAKLARMTPTELEEKRRRRNAAANQRNRERRAQWTEADREKLREAKRQSFNNMSPEKKARFQMQQKEYHKRKMEKLKQDPEEFAKWKENTDKRKKQMNDLWKKFRNGLITKEELAQLEIKMHVGRGRGAYKDETPEQRLQRFAEARKKYIRRTDMKKRLKIQQKGMSLDDIKRRQLGEETPQQREHRLMRHRVNSAKIRTQKRLQAAGAHPAEIERKLIEVEEICKAKPTLPYKPRKRRQLKPKPELIPNKSELGYSSLSSFLVEKQDVDNSPSLRQPYHLQQQEQPAYQIEGSSQNQVPFIHSANPDTFNLDKQESTSSSSHLDVDATCSHINYDHSQISHDYTSPASLEPISSPAPSYPDPSSPQTPNHVVAEDYVTPPKNAVGDQVVEYFMPSSTKKFSTTQRSTPTRKRNVVSDYFQMGRLRGPQKNRVGTLERNMICEDCGIAYNQHTYYGHRRLYHNPNFKDGRCLVCGEEFTVIRDWYYKHYRIVHPEHEPRRRGKRESASTLPKRRKRGSEADPNLFDPEKRPHLCTQCGKGYATMFGLQNHEKFAHGDWSKAENFLDCRFCNRKFKRKQGLDKHMVREHKAGVWSCEKCDKFCESLAQLYEHLKNDHENSYFACEFCKAVHTSEVAIKFHTNQCKKAPMERLLELRKKWKDEGDLPVSSVFIGCEFCPANVSVHSLGRHFTDVHGLPREESHGCNQCGKIFKRREHYVCHLAGIHNIPIQECLDLSRPYNVKNRKGLEPINAEGKVKKTKGKRGRKKKVVTPDSGEEPQLKKAGGTGRGRGRPRKQKTGEDFADEIIEKHLNSSGESQDEQKARKEMKESPIKKPIVTASSGSSRSRRQSAQMTQTKILLSQSENSDDEESDKDDKDEDDEESDKDDKDEDDEESDKEDKDEDDEESDKEVNDEDDDDLSSIVKLEAEEMDYTEDEDYN